MDWFLYDNGLRHEWVNTWDTSVTGCFSELIRFYPPEIAILKPKFEDDN